MSNALMMAVLDQQASSQLYIAGAAVSPFCTCRYVAPGKGTWQWSKSCQAQVHGCSLVDRVNTHSTLFDACLSRYAALVTCVFIGLIALALVVLMSATYALVSMIDVALLSGHNSCKCCLHCTTIVGLLPLS